MYIYIHIKHIYIYTHIDNSNDPIKKQPYVEITIVVEIVMRIRNSNRISDNIIPPTTTNNSNNNNSNHNNNNNNNNNNVLLCLS